MTRTPEQRRDWWAFLLREASRPDLAHEAAQGRFDPANKEKPND